VLAREVTDLHFNLEHGERTWEYFERIWVDGLGLAVVMTNDLVTRSRGDFRARDHGPLARDDDADVKNLKDATGHVDRVLNRMQAQYRPDHASAHGPHQGDSESL
jgi:hypothetical protein